jgi:nucleotide-binding universal stress UspA family protein
MMAGLSSGTMRLVNVLPLTPVMLAEYVPPDFEAQQRKSSEEALAIICKETALDPARVSSVVRQGGIHQEILEEANAIGADLIVMSSHRVHRPDIRTYFLGSNAGHVVRHAQCSVLVVRQAGNGAHLDRFTYRQSACRCAAVPGTAASTKPVSNRPGCRR